MAHLAGLTRLQTLSLQNLAVTDKGLHFVWGQSKYTFRLMPDGSMLGELDSTNSRGHFNLSISFDRIE